MEEKDRLEEEYDELYQRDCKQIREFEKQVKKRLLDTAKFKYAYAGEHYEIMLGERD